MSNCKHIWVKDELLGSGYWRCSECNTMKSDGYVVAALAARIAALESQLQWISVEERLPSRDDRVLAINTRGHVTLINCTHGRNCHAWSDPLFTPTHWMPLPAPPEEK